MLQRGAGWRHEHAFHSKGGLLSPSRIVPAPARGVLSVTVLRLVFVPSEAGLRTREFGTRV